MWTNAHEVYFQDRVLGADRLELVRMLYSGAIEAVRAAREELAAGRISQRSQAIGKAYRIIAELATSLDRARGGEIAVRLLELYDYMMRRLTEANFQQKDQPLEEVLGLLSTLSEGWNGVIQQTATQNSRSEAWESAANEPQSYSETYSMAGYGSQGFGSQAWSF
jgi:flagellar protein FliS